MTKAPILILSGTNRPGSNALRLARLIEAHYQRADHPTDLLSLADLPPEIFHPDAYATKPPAFEPIQQRVLKAGGLHIVTPEYNGSFPGVLKYFIDMLKFPESFDRKPVALVGEAAGLFGALRAVEQLQMIFGYRQGYIYPDRVFLAAVRDKLSPEGRLIDPTLDDRLAKQVRGFCAFVCALGFRI